MSRGLAPAGIQPLRNARRAQGDDRRGPPPRAYGAPLSSPTTCLSWDCTLTDCMHAYKYTIDAFTTSSGINVYCSTCADHC